MNKQKIIQTFLMLNLFLYDLLWGMNDGENKTDVKTLSSHVKIKEISDIFEVLNQFEESEEGKGKSTSQVKSKEESKIFEEISDIFKVFNQFEESEEGGVLHKRK